MIVFVCPEPTSTNESDGLLQRVKAIDAGFEQHERVILSLGFTKNLRRRRFRRSSNLTVEYLNVFLHWFRICKLAKHASSVYVHTCNHAFRILPLYLILKRIITDLHGAVPEEIAMEGKRFASWRYRYIEKVVVRGSAALVFVTESMRQFFQNKYERITSQSFIIPVFSTLAPATSGQRDPKLAVYAGGTQSWQCIDEMLDASAALSSKLKFVFLTGDKDALKKRVELRRLTASVETCPRERIGEWYSKASFGFVLRDESVVNAVACPTKLVEYMHFGVVPIVKLTDIGDFGKHGYRYLRLSDCIEGMLPTEAELESARAENHVIIERMADNSRKALLALVELTSRGEMGRARKEGTSVDAGERPQGTQ